MATSLCIAHRGASVEAPENTLAAFRRALEIGVDGIELDVQTTRDKVAVVFHDDSLERLTEAKGKISELTAAKLKAFLVDGEPIPTLFDVLKLIRGRAHVQIELKQGVLLPPVLKAIAQARASAWVTLASFEHDLLLKAVALAPKLPRMLITDGLRSKIPPETAALKILGTMRAVAASGISINYKAITAPRFVEVIHQHGVPVWCWTVNDARTMVRLAHWG
ncbi:MAG TPA: glycerophosphodiester phosphodiesterase, partial [Opitutaceae bacterium]|nr:glycerophosphodiester phosphodiesterase [Opitutaceae bacterium]